VTKKTFEDPQTIANEEPDNPFKNIGDVLKKSIEAARKYQIAKHKAKLKKMKEKGDVLEKKKKKSSKPFKPKPAYVDKIAAAFATLENSDLTRKIAQKFKEPNVIYSVSDLVIYIPPCNFLFFFAERSHQKNCCDSRR
jgi:thymidylate synthase